MKIRNFKSIVSKYKVVFFDAFGVLKNAHGRIDGVDRTIDYLNAQGIGYYVLTNDASRSPELLADSYHRVGLHDITPDKIISSGMLASEYLRYKVKKGKVAYLGTPNSAHYIETLSLTAIPIGELDPATAEDVEVVVFLDDEGFDWNRDINKVINLLRHRNIPAIVANSDKAYPVSKNEVAAAIGAIANMVEDVTGKRIIRFGKPDAQMFIYAYEHVQPMHPVDKNDILMVGDTLGTDILGGNKFGLDTVMVLSGNTPAHLAKQYIQATGITPTYICESAAITE
ncbi:HAD-superfamily class IIA hydrolase, TIGR01459 [Catalinimonas alkaloidigena]|uniref:HAD-superfamily class IIA hydrolase, TIGR01459 n=1 Tax=Catalinimonas alkaloidigena TaxID=1075417 RepID=A0A1G9PDV2_9BACT|nr:HAD-IIA family hydrolase [Catalinimonas alkaloidigena]SDL96325.1 HAD-superfamily class IIA hydrolase, TIGR01459 [Catalinimonas alkaloidigena]